MITLKERRFKQLIGLPEPVAMDYSTFMQRAKHSQKIQSIEIMKPADRKFHHKQHNFNCLKGFLQKDIDLVEDLYIKQ